jgi:hypothetical protein
MKKEAHELFPPIFADVIARMPGMFVQAIYDLESDIVGEGRIAIIGDAGFVARPHCGAGVSKAADDAASLADALARHERVNDAVAAFSADRTVAGRAAVRWAARLGSYFQMDPTGQRRSDFNPKHPPVGPEFIVKYTGIELSEVTEDVL